MTDTTTMPPQPPPTPPAGVQAPPPPPPPRRPGGGAVTWGIVLIVVGVLLLFGRFIPMGNIFAFWPMIIIIAGVIQAVTPGKEGWSVAKLFDGLVTVAFGLVFLAIMMGIVGWSVWGRIIVFWPVLVISIGLEILGKALHSSWPKVLGSIAIIAALGYSVGTSASGLESPRLPSYGVGVEEYRLSEQAGTIDEASLSMDVGVAQLDMLAGDELVGIEGRSSFGRPSIEVDSNSDPAEVDVRLGDKDVVVWPSEADFDVSVSRDVLWDMAINVGVSEFDADFSDVRLSGLTLKPGVAECQVRLGDAPNEVDTALVTIESGVSSVNVEVPEGAAARVEIESGISGNSVRGDFRRQGDGKWETPGYQQALSRGDAVWLIKVKSGIGSINIDSY